MTSSAWTLITLAAAALLLGAALWLRCEGTLPEVEAPQELYVGKAGARIALAPSDADSGIRAITVRLRHAGGQDVLHEERYPGNPFSGASLRPAPPPIEVEIDPTALELRDGSAFVEVEAVDWSWSRLFSGNASRLEIPVTVDLQPPRLRIETGLTYVRRGGASAVVYRLDEAPARDGVEVGDAFFPGHPLPGAGDEAARVALFAVARDAPTAAPIRVIAVDRAGNHTARSWPTRLVERRFDEIRIDVSEHFLDTKVRELAESMGIQEGGRVRDFQKINREVRAANEHRIREIVAETSPRPLWSGAFSQLRNSAVQSRFAEHRTYYRAGEEISQAIHYGYDLASTAGAPVEAAGAGRVIFADELGIYGNSVILDHGLGLASLYAHLSRMDVSRGDAVEKGRILGLTGSTGLAGGDHLHFAILVGGTYVDPKEWWDPKWVREHVEVRLGQP